MTHDPERRRRPGAPDDRRVPFIRGAPLDNAEHRHRPEGDDLSARLVRFLPGVGPAVLRAARALGVLAPYTPDAHWNAGDPFEQARAVERDGEVALVAAAITLTLCMDEEAIGVFEPRVLTLRSAQHPYSNWWQSRLSPQSLPARPIGPPPRSEVLMTPEPPPFPTTNGTPGTGGERGERP
jgi:hypothetical protein